MITEIGIEGFKSLEKVDLKLGKLNLFVGANASGKSSFLDALRVLQGIGYGFSIAEIFKLLRTQLFEEYRFMNLFLFLPDSDGKDRSAEFQSLEREAEGWGIRIPPGPNVETPRGIPHGASLHW